MWAPELSFLNLGPFALALVAAAAGSLHCVGMCGPIRFIAGGSLPSSFAYQGGRLLAYSVLGLSAGLLGAFISPLLLICLFVAVVLALVFKLGLPFSTGALRGQAISRLARNPLLLGVGTGLLPCGMLYGWIAAAVATRSPLQGVAFLFALWLGTLPALEASTRILRKPFEQLRRRFPRSLPVALLLLAFIPIGTRLGLAAFPKKAASLRSTESQPYCHGPNWHTSTTIEPIPPHSH